MATKGRPTKYKAEFAEQARKLTILGAIDTDLADFFGVTIATIHNWKNKHKAFLDAIKDGKDYTDNRVERSLFERATGYSHPETKVLNNNGEPVEVKITKHYPPDTAAAFIWLKNRRPEKWRDKHEVEHSGIEPITIKVVNADD